jgi:hypothetical protein
MIVGIDFDNTIMDYDALFYKVACEKSLVLPSIEQTKLAVRDYLRGINQEDAWTELQGYIYGARMNETAVYPGFWDFLCSAGKKNVEVFIISHKTRIPFIGPRYDLHAAARNSIESKGFYNPAVSKLTPDHIHFELTKKEKCDRIGMCRCQYFIDDLPEIFHEKSFPENTVKVLFDPQYRYSNEKGVIILSSWLSILQYFNGIWS